MKKQDILENQAKKVILSLGSNLGNRYINLEKAKFLLLNHEIKILKSSSYYETNSWPNIKFPKYLNIVIEILTFLKPLSLFLLIKKIEKILGRKKSMRNYPRTCDIDIVDYDGKIFEFISKNTNLIIPHPRMKSRNFVLIPLYEISSNWIHPKSKEKISKMLSKIDTNHLRSIKLI